MKNQIENSDLALGERYLTLCEAAEVLHLSGRTVREYVKRGEIRGKIHRFPMTFSLKTHPLSLNLCQ